MAKKHRGGLAVNWKFRVSIANRQTKILITKKRKIIIKYLAWLSTKLKGQSFKLPYDFLAGSLCIMRKIVQTIEISAKKAHAQTAHLFFCQREKPTLKKIKELFLSNAQMRLRKSVIK
ncbi:MAG: hypothetical protein ACI87X_001385 [Candidatus Arcticimaribacter sp.]|jgi:hypothetical protein